MSKLSLLWRRVTALRTTATLLLALAAISTGQAAALYGQVTGAQTRQPIADAEVQVHEVSTFPRLERTVRTNAAGLYAIDGLPEGRYVLHVTAAGHVRRVASREDARNCDHVEHAATCVERLSRAESGRPAVLAAEQRLPLDVQAELAARLTGRIDPASNALRSDARVQFGTGADLAAFPVGADGSIDIDHIVPGTYVIGLCATGAICRDASGAEFDLLGADAARLPLSFAAGRTLNLPDLPLRAEALIGLVPPFTPALYMDPRNLPQLTVYREGQAPVTLPPQAEFRPLAGLRPGRFRLLFGQPDDTRWLARWHDGTDCSRSRCDATQVAPIILDSGESRTGVTVALQPRQRISGQVLQAGTAQAITGMWVLALRWEPFGEGLSLPLYQNLTTTDEQGRYELIGLEPGAYVLMTVNGSAAVPWLSERWPGVRCSELDLETCLPVNEGQFLLHPDQQAGGVDFTPELGGILSGRFTGTAPTSTTYVAIEASGSRQVITTGYDPATGDRAWRSLPLPVGTYSATAFVYRGLDQPTVRRIFQPLDCLATDPQCAATSERGAILAVVAGREAAGVDFDFGFTPAALIPAPTAKSTGPQGKPASVDCLSLLPNDRSLGCRLRLYGEDMARP